MKIIFKKILFAITFLTIVPVPTSKKNENIALAQAMSFFPLVGFLIGSCCYGLCKVSAVFNSALLSAVLIQGFCLWITGALHIEGLVDTIDGFSAGPDQKTILRVMKDKHCGAKGAAISGFLLLAKVVLIAECVRCVQFKGIMLMPVFSRWVMVNCAVFCQYARDNVGLGKVFVDNAGIREFLFASITTIFLGWLFLPEHFISLMIFYALFAGSAVVYLTHKLRGITGDVLGALNELSWIVGLLFILKLNL
ncbi:MAG: adenosylcobinamide-GDP ribazoletransferase [Candidatus Omnitrophota bacterium]|nr:MAG: adenosylcobinamide-GDP ribazoletransferase [Candidatus Omnitrophota bacterium]